METSIVAVEENQQKGDSSSRVSKSLGSVKNIDSISIDLDVSMEKTEAEKCQHFSIRGYVADMRIKDWRIGSPFALDGNMSEDQLSMLPPLHVPKFRWWGCQNCLQDIGTSSTASEGIGVVSSYSEGFRSSSRTGSDIPSLGDEAMVPSDSQLISRLDKIKGRNADINAPAGHQNYSKEDADQNMGTTSCDVTELNLSPIQESHTDGTGCEAVAIKANNSGLVKICEPNCELPDASNITPAMESHSCPCSSSAAIFPTNTNSADGERRKVFPSCKTSKEVGNNIDAVNGQTVTVPSVELERHDDESSGSDELFAGKRQPDQQHDNTSGLPRQKMRKVRLLSELLSAKGVGETHHSKKEGASSKALATASDGLASLIAPVCQVALHENVGKVPRDPQRKRKVAQVGDQKPMDTSSPLNIAKKVRAIGRDADATLMTIEDGTVRSPTLVKKNDEQTYSPVISWQEVMPNINHVKIGDASKSAAADSSFPKSNQDANSGRGTEPYFRSYMSPGQMERKSSLSKKKNKTPEIDDGQFTLMPQSNSLFGEGSSIKRKGFIQAESEIVQPLSANDVSANIGLDLTLCSYMPAQRKQKNDPLLPQQKGIPSKDPEKRDGICAGESSILHKSAPTPSLREELLSDLNMRIHRTAIPCDRQNGSPLLEDSFSPYQKSDFSGPYSNGKTLEVHRHSEVIAKHNDQRADKVLEEGTSDEIPMEIVELMAKNQYERGLYEYERNYCSSERTNNKRNSEIMGLPKVHGNKRLLQKEHPAIRRFSSGNARNGIIMTAENFGATKANLFDFSNVNGSRFNGCQLRGNPAFTMFSSFPQSRQELSSPIQLSASGSIGNLNSQNRQLYGDKTMHRNSPTKMQVLEAYESCHTGSRHNKKTEHIWSPMTPNQIPFGFHVSQKCATQSSNMKMHAHSSGPLNQGKVIRDLDLNSVDQSAVNIEKQNENLDSESLKRTSAEYPFFPKQGGLELNPNAKVSVDAYSNENIPAMQLLSLMDGTPFKLDPKKFLEKPFSPCDYHPKFSVDEKQKFLEKSNFPYPRSTEFTGLVPGAYNTCSSSRHPSYASYSKNHLSETSHECSSYIPAVNPFAALSQYHGNFRSAASMTGQMSIKSQEPLKEKRYYSLTENSDRRSQKYLHASGVSETVYRSFSGQDKQKGIIGASNSMALPLHCNALENSTKCPEMAGSRRPMKSMSGNGACSFNRNPADFSIPAARNMYMIRGEDLKFGRKKPSRERSSLIIVDGQKPQKVTKLKAAKECTQHHTR